MNTRQLYRYLFTELTQEEEKDIPDLFGKHKNAWKFRGILRTLHAEKFEQALYGNATDILESYETPYEAEWNWEEEFNRINNQYHYVESNPGLAENFKQLFYVIKFLDEVVRNHGYGSSFESFGEFAYKLMVYFGENDVSETLANFDKFRAANKCNNQSIDGTLESDLRAKKQLKDISAWQKIIVEGNTPEAIDLFRLAHEIEAVLGDSPRTLIEAKEAYSSLPSVREWNREQLLLMYSAAKSEQDQLHLITSISGQNLKTLISDSRKMSEMLQKTREPNVRVLLDRLGASYIKDILKDKYDVNEQLKVLRNPDITHFITNIIGLDDILKSHPAMTNFSMFLEYDLPKRYNKQELLLLLSKEQLSGYLRGDSGRLYMQKLLIFIDSKERFNFLVNKIGEETLASIIDSAFTLVQILDELPFEQRLPFIKEVMTPDRLKDMRMEERYWSEIKSRLRNEGEKDAFNQFVYSDEELADKSTLKNIKNEICRTKWQFSMFETPVYTYIKRHKLVVPRPVISQINSIWDVRSREKTHSQAIADIKRIGKAESKASNGIMTGLSHSLYGKSPNEEYFEKFSSDEAFNKAFLNKKSE